MAESTTKCRTLVLCFDGTSNEYDADNTNLPLFFSLLKKDDFNEQLCYYQPGIGTWFNPGVVSPVFQWGAKILDYAFAWYLNEHVMDGYKFIMQNWRIGDKICLFGFSRGAYTARALGGMLYKVGLLPRDNEQQIPFAYKMYKKEDKAGIALCKGFKETYCQDVKIEYMGVWDTVASVGLVMGRTLPFVSSNTSIKTFRHALSLDERRARFMPNLYHRTPAAGEVVKIAAIYEDEQEPAIEIKASSDSDSSDSGIASGSSDGPPERTRNRKKRFLPFRFRSAGKVRASKAEEGTPDDVLEVWFAGCHSDIGGGAEPNGTPNSLAYITLRWMVREIVKSGCGIQFDEDALQRAKIDPASSESPLADGEDAVQPLHDELKSNPLWWILEIFPMKFTWQDANGVWQSSFGWHLGRGRRITDKTVVFHSSVKSRMESSLGYIPRAQWESGSEIYVS
ncbi:hypothetical protein P691DRAFT_738143 [Macrolepiota fuliginosa MF-IS2]|uniref:T6SS Phospholipase effector Tle1-like catalytic domain-containing protein n=1 Tax=Macrolepiota fuliginosa MF-IS2 TaxID=1400762 RepID=A0A9P5X394_9AGAR|nr:hypothetical protein P691DRAFT_738143 [Macrolepiota fuliginosa MF-IS2]